LANHPEVRKVDAEAAKEWGMGYPMGARMMSGQTSKHEELENNLADFVGKEDAFLLNYGLPGDDFHCTIPCEPSRCGCF